jgi:glycosyltransferase involved in cell wall biosynthesis
MPISIEIVIPVLNEERSLPRCIDTVAAFVAQHPAREWRLRIADNGSTDGTLRVAEELKQKHPNLQITHLDQRGRGRALRKAWTESDADVRCYMDVDLSTGLDALPLLVDAVADDGCDVAIGSRLIKGSQIVGRKVQREITSRGYNAMIRTMFPRAGFHDAQCGFKAVSRRAAESLVPLVADNRWFFDTELLLIARAWGWKVREVPVHWEDDPDTRVKIVSTAWEDVKGLLRLRFGGIPGKPQ